jgi:hypothetical protein
MKKAPKIQYLLDSAAVAVGHQAEVDHEEVDYLASSLEADQEAVAHEFPLMVYAGEA